VRKMQSQAHDAINKLAVHDKTHPAFTELDRIGGKTQLISTSTPPAASPSDSSTVSTPESTHTGTTASSAQSSFYESTFNNSTDGAEMHPILITDMRTFEGFSAKTNDPSVAVPMDFDFDLSQAFPLPLDRSRTADFQPQVQDISSYIGVDIFGANNINTMPMSDNTMLPGTSFGDIPSPMGNMSVTVPELHATWQSFVEQLGFKF
jgi:hypothetical protein